jgi:hypothetical protein
LLQRLFDKKEEENEEKTVIADIGDYVFRVDAFARVMCPTGGICFAHVWLERAEYSYFCYRHRV